AGMVGEVEELGAEIEGIAFRNLELLAQAEVPVEEAGSAHRPDTCASKFPKWLISESVRAAEAGAERVARVVDITVGNAAVDWGRGKLIRANRAARVLQRAARDPSDCDREAGVSAENAAHAPTAKDRVRNRMPIFAECAALANRQFIRARPD